MADPAKHIFVYSITNTQGSHSFGFFTGGVQIFKRRIQADLKNGSYSIRDSGIIIRSDAKLPPPITQVNDTMPFDTSYAAQGEYAFFKLPELEHAGWSLQTDTVVYDGQKLLHYFDCSSDCRSYTGHEYLQNYGAIYLYDYYVGTSAVLGDYIVLDSVDSKPFTFGR